jgi:hypothetical protein
MIRRQDIREVAKLLHRIILTRASCDSLSLSLCPSIGALHSSLLIKRNKKSIKRKTPKERERFFLTHDGKRSRVCMLLAFSYFPCRPLLGMRCIDCGERGPEKGVWGRRARCEEEDEESGRGRLGRAGACVRVCVYFVCFGDIASLGCGVSGGGVMGVAIADLVGPPQRRERSERRRACALPRSWISRSLTRHHSEWAS